MKTLLLTLLVFISFKSFATEVGEDQKPPCPYANQSSSRDAKIVLDSGDDSNKEAPTALSK